MQVFEVKLSSDELRERMVAIPVQPASPVRRGERVIVRGHDGATFLGMVVNRIEALGDLVVRLSVRLPQSTTLVPAQRQPV